VNILTALILSTKRQATCYISLEKGRRTIYKCLISASPDEVYTFEVFHITYPERAPGKGLGDPCIAEKPHSFKRMSSEDLLEFLEIYFNELEWTPVEEN
jgi:hypothetical protein